MQTIGHLGIRYARAQRFEPPVAVPFAGIGSEAGRPGPVAPQVPGMLENLLGIDTSSMDEDCLFLNVFRPASAHEGDALPVLVWIHGGAFQNGSGSIPWYDGSNLAARGVIVVTINYRLGAFGYLGDRNCGTLDQVCALEWVRDNIARFGGDASNVTIFGESAGGSGVLALLAAPSADGLFHRAWSMSPSIRQLRGIDSARGWEERFLEAAGVDGVDAARTLDVTAVLEAQAKVAAMPSDGYDMFAPTAGGAGLETDLHAAMERNPVPVVIGTNRDENSLFLAFDPEIAGCGRDKWIEHARNHFGDAADDAVRVYEEHRDGATPAQLIAAVQTDHVFRRPAQKVAESRVAAGNPTWMYWFTWGTPVFDGALGSCHALDIPFAFDNIAAPGSEFMTGTGPERAAIAARFADEIVRFAVEGAPGWTAFNLDARPTLRIDTLTELLHDPEPQLRELHP